MDHEEKMRLAEEISLTEEGTRAAIELGMETAIDRYGREELVELTKEVIDYADALEACIEKHILARHPDISKTSLTMSKELLTTYTLHLVGCAMSRRRMQTWHDAPGRKVGYYRAIMDRIDQMYRSAMQRMDA
jgi:hypothetical protein